VQRSSVIFLKVMQVKGDRLVIEEGHVRAARQVMKLLLTEISGSQRIFTIAIAGESGGGRPIGRPQPAGNQGRENEDH
jgi:hypothetical protein